MDPSLRTTTNSKRSFDEQAEFKNSRARDNRYTGRSYSHDSKSEQRSHRERSPSRPSSRHYNDRTSDSRIERDRFSSGKRSEPEARIDRVRERQIVHTDEGNHYEDPRKRQRVDERDVSNYRGSGGYNDEEDRNYILKKRILNAKNSDEMEQLLDKIEELSPINISTAISTLSKMDPEKLGTNTTKILQKLAKRTSEIISQFPARNLVDIFLGFTNLQERYKELINPMLDEILIELGSLNKQKLFDIIVKLSEFNIQNEKLLTSLAQHLVDHFDEYNRYERSTIAQIFARFRFNYKPFFEKYQDIASQQTSSHFRRGEIPTYEHLVCIDNNKRILAAKNIEGLLSCTEEIDQFNPTNISTFFHCASKMPITELNDKLEGVLSKLAERAANIISTFDLNSLTSIIWSCSKLEKRYEKLNTAVVNELQGQYKNMDKKHISSTIFAFTYFNIKHERLLSDLVKRILDMKGKFTDYDLIGIAQNFARLRFYDRNFFAALPNPDRSAHHHVSPEQQYQNFIQMEINDRIKRAKNIEDLFSCMKDLDQFDAAHITTFLDHIQKMQTQESEIQINEMLDKLAERSIAIISTFQPHQLAFILNSYVKYGKIQSDFFEVLIPQIIETIDNMFVRDLFAIVRSLAEIKMNLEEVLNPITLKIISDRRFLFPGEISGIAKAFAKLEIKDENLFKHLAIEAFEKIKDFKNSEMVEFITAFADLNIFDKNTFLTFRSWIIENIDKFSTREYKKILYSFSSLKVISPELYGALATQIKRRIDKFSARELSSIVNSLAIANHEDNANFNDKDLFEIIARELSQKEKIDTLSSKQLCETVVAYALIGYRNEVLFGYLCRAIGDHIQNISNQEIADILWSFAKLGVDDKELWRKLIAIAKPRVDSFEIPDTVKIVWALAYARYCDPDLDPDLIESLAKNTLSNISIIQQKFIASAAWAFSVLEYSDNEFYVALTNRINGFEANRWNDRELSQLEETALYLKFSMKWPIFKWNESLTSFINKSKEKSRFPSEEVQCISLLKQLGYFVERDCFVSDLPISIGLIKRNISLEIQPLNQSLFNNQAHFRPSIKTKLLHDFGWKVLLIPYMDWVSLSNDSEKKNYLKNLINTYTQQ